MEKKEHNKYILMSFTFLICFVLIANFFQNFYMYENKENSFSASPLNQEQVSVSSLKTLANEIFFNQFDEVKNRIAGSDGEKFFANVLSEELNHLGLNYLLDNESYIQTFEIPKSKTSQNVVGFIDNNSTQSIILSAHYDAIYKENESGESISYGFNDNLSGVLGVLCMAKMLLELTPKPEFNIIIVFYGSEEIGCVGSKFFIKNLDEDLKSKILLAINFDSIGGGEFLYYYHSDFQSKYGTTIDSFSNSQNLAISKLGFHRLFSTLSNGGFNYSTIALCSDNSTYLLNGINSLLLFSGNLNTYNGFGFFEKQDVPRIMHLTDTRQVNELIFGELFYYNIITSAEFCFSLITANKFDEENFFPNQINPLVYSDWTLKLMGISLILIILIIFKIINRKQLIVNYKQLK